MLNPLDIYISTSVIVNSINRCCFLLLFLIVYLFAIAKVLVFVLCICHGRHVYSCYSVIEIVYSTYVSLRPILDTFFNQLFNCSNSSGIPAKDIFKED